MSKPSRTPSPLDWGLPRGLGVPLFTAHRITPAPGTLSAARRFTRHTLSAWYPTATQEWEARVMAVAGELVTNALQHALAPAPTQSGWLALHGIHRALVCAVRDPSTKLPQRHNQALASEAVRGLQLITELSDGWGYQVLGNDVGKTVWARILCRT
ncbi:ATP-binding protein [Streptomyces sp. NPDC020965]|uniref:ATP-binding protein n=1 Tax=Streptomyces sp. NPDC020965 TaxID=3365105 RepID=UPI00379B479B